VDALQCAAAGNTRMLRIGGFYRNRVGRCDVLLLILNFRYARPLLSGDSFETAFERQPNRAEPSWSESRKRQGARGGIELRRRLRKERLAESDDARIGLITPIDLGLRHSSSCVTGFLDSSASIIVFKLFRLKSSQAWPSAICVAARALGPGETFA